LAIAFGDTQTVASKSMLEEGGHVPSSYSILEEPNGKNQYQNMQALQ